MCSRRQWFYPLELVVKYLIKNYNLKIAVMQHFGYLLEHGRTSNETHKQVVVPHFLEVTSSVTHTGSS